MRYLQCKRERIEKLKAPCIILIPTTYSSYGKAYILREYDEEKGKYRLIDAHDPFKERFVKGNTLVIYGFEDINI